MRARKTRLRSVTFGLCLLAALMVIAPATTQGKSKPITKEISIKPANAQRSRSVRYPWDGQLMRGMRLRESKLVRYLPEDAPRGRFFGTWQLVQLLQRAAQKVALRYPGSRATFGELSGKQGGDIDGHSSHESGRDADVGFYITRNDGSPFGGNTAFVEFDSYGRGRAPNGHLRFDVKRNWEYVSKLVDDDDARVQYIFVQRGLRNLLLKQAVKRGASPTIIARASSVLVEPAHGNPHRSHFHVRIYCPPTDRPVCLDVAPYWPWYPGGVLAAVNNAVSKTPLSPLPEATPSAP